MKKRILAFVLCFCIMFSLMPTWPATAEAAPSLPSTLYVSNGAIKIEDGTDTDTIKVTYTEVTYTESTKKTVDNLPMNTEITIIGTTASNSVIVNTAAKLADNTTAKTIKITLSYAKIDVSSKENCAAFDIQGNSVVNLTLVSINSLKSSKHMAGLQVNTTATVTIGGTGTLTATGNDSAGIGGGTIVITGNANVEANGANSYAGIGAGTIVITGYASVKAKGGDYAAGIGGKYVNVGADITINENAVVTATGGKGGAGIGGAGISYGNNASDVGYDIKIGGNASVTAIGGSDQDGGGAGIGRGRLNCKAGKITISGGNIVATGGKSLGGIGDGGHGIGNNDDTISISAGTVIATSIDTYGIFGAKVMIDDTADITAISTGDSKRWNPEAIHSKETMTSTADGKTVANILMVKYKNPVSAGTATTVKTSGGEDLYPKITYSPVTGYKSIAIKVPKFAEGQTSENYTVYSGYTGTTKQMHNPTGYTYDPNNTFSIKAGLNTFSNVEDAIPFLKAGEVSRTSDTKATVQFTSDQTGTYYYSIGKPATDSLGGGTNFNTSKQTITLTNLDAGRKYIYIIVKNAAGRVSLDNFIITIPEYVAPTYTVTYDSQDATTEANPNSKTVVSSATVGSLPTPPQKTGFTFGGWFTEINGGGKEFTENTPVTGNITVYAYWTGITYGANNHLFANGNAIIISSPNGDDKSNIYIDSNANGIIDAGEVPVDLYAIRGSYTAPKGDTTNGFELSEYSILGGSTKALKGDTKITMLSGNAGAVYGGGGRSNGSTVENTNITIKGGSVGAVCATGPIDNTNVNGYAVINVEGGNITRLIELSSGYSTVGNYSIIINGGSVTHVKTEVYNRTNVRPINNKSEILSKTELFIGEESAPARNTRITAKDIDIKGIDYSYGLNDVFTNYYGYLYLWLPEGAVATPPTYTVEYNGNNQDSGSVATQTTKVGTETKVSANGFIKEGFNFEGWNTKADGTGTPYAVGKIIPSQTARTTITLYAQWTAIAPQTYTVTYHGNGADSGSVDTQTAKVGTTTTVSTNGFRKTGYDFTGWNTKADGTGTPYAVGKIIPSQTAGTTITLYAQWTAQTYTVVYNGNNQDSGSVATQRTKVGTETKVSANGFIKTGFNFEGWNTKADGTGTAYAVDAIIPSQAANTTVILFAQWTEAAAQNYYVVYNGNYANSGSVATQTTNVGTVTKVSANGFEKTGFTFTGWNTAADGYGTSYTEGAIILSQAANTTVILYAQWKENTSTPTDKITIKINGTYDPNTNTIGNDGVQYSGTSVDDAISKYLVATGYTAVKQLKIIAGKVTTDDWRKILALSYMINFEIDSAVTEVANIPESYSNAGQSKVIESVKIPQAISIGKFAFSHCSNLKAVICPKAVTIGENAFDSCVALTTANFPEVTTIGFSAFYNCSNLKAAIYPKAVTIGDFAFAKCKALTTADFPEVTTIADSAFSECEALATVSFPRAKIITNSAFGGCKALTTVYFSEVTTIYAFAFSSCEALTTANFPKATNIGGSAFEDCKALTTISFPEATTINSNAFYRCGALITASFPKAIDIMDYAFSDCYSLTKLSVPLIKNFGQCTFNMCTALTTLEIGATPPSLKNGNAFSKLTQTKSLFFINADGTELTGSALTAAQNAYKADDNYYQSDGHDLWAGWIIARSSTKTYTVVYNGNSADSGSVATQTTNVGTATTASSNGFSKAGFTFKGWNTKADGTGTAYTEGASIPSQEAGTTITLYAQWTEAAAQTYTVVYNGNGADSGSVATQTTKVGTETTVSKNEFSKAGFTFKGWNTKADGTGTAYDVGASIPSQTAGTTITLYAQWIEMAAQTYTVVYTGNGSDSGSVATQTTKVGTTTTVSANGFSKAGFTFKGWNTKADGTGTPYAVGESVSSQEAGTTITFYAQWQENKYEIIGTVKDGNSNNVSGATVKIMRGRNQIGLSVQTDTNGQFTIANVTNGTYNLVISSGTAPNEVVITKIIVVRGENCAAGTIVLPNGKTSSVVEVKENTPSVVVGNLDGQFSAIVTDNDKGVTAADQAVVTSGGAIEIKLTVEAKDDTAQNAGDIVIVSTQDGKTVGIFVDLSVMKTVVTSGSSISMTNIVELPNLIDVYIPLDSSLQGKSSYVVYRYHGTAVDTITESVNAYGEKIQLVDNNTTIQLTVKKFSTYAVGYTETAKYDLNVNLNGGSGSTASGKYSSGDAVSINAGSRSGYSFNGWTSSNGGTFANANSSSTTFTMPANDTAITANWRSDSSDSDSSDRGSSDSNSSYNYYTITASATEGGTISPSGKTSVREQSDNTFTITQDKGYIISDVLVDGESVGAVEKYTFKDIVRNHTIKAIFAIDIKTNPETGSHNPFKDVDENDWFFDKVLKAYEKGLIIGTSENTFSPYLETSRASITTIIYSLEGKPACNGQNEFNDVKAGEWYSEAIAWGYENGIVFGYGDGTFKPEQNITRQEFCTILHHYAKYKGYDVSKSSKLLDFTDGKDVSNWALEQVKWTVGTEIMNGKGNGILDPKGFATRAEVCVMMLNFMDCYSK